MSTYRALRRLTVLTFAGLLAGCATGTLAPPGGEPIPDMEGFARVVTAATVPAGPQQVNFDWSLDEQGSRVNGRGVVRVEAPARIRLDLFGARGETYLMAALVGEQYRLPPSATGAVSLPSPSLLWAALGVLRPPADAALASARREEGDIELRYITEAEETFVYSVSERGDPEAGGATEYRLLRLERAGGQGVVETITLDWDESEPTRTRYRDWSAYRDLTLQIQEVRQVDSFPGDIWRP